MTKDSVLKREDELREEYFASHPLPKSEQDVSCKQCKAGPGEPCAINNGKQKWHAKRCHLLAFIVEKIQLASYDYSGAVLEREFRGNRQIVEYNFARQARHESIVVRKSGGVWPWPK